MSILQKLLKKRFVNQSNYNMTSGIPQNQFFNQSNNTPEFYRPFDDYHNQYQDPYQQNDNGWNQHFSESPSNQNFYQNDFALAYGYQSFEENYCSNNNKRAREYYNDNDDYNNYDCGGSNVAKKQKLTVPSVKYGFKKSSEYPQPMRKVLDILFQSEITADGWKKVNGKFNYHTEIRGNKFNRMGNSIDNAREQVAETALKALCNFKFENITWPRHISSFRLEQPFADAIENIVKNKFDDLMQNDLQYKAHKVRSGIVMTNGWSLDEAKVVAIGTGTKCFSDKYKDQNGTILHDMHAEVLARRSFIRFLYDQLEAMVDKKPSIFHLDVEEIKLKEDLKFHLYVNTIPCGDARVFSLKGCAELKKTAKQGTLRMKKIGGTEILSESTSHRVKSMSCSDKIARWNVLGLQGAALTKHIKPIYLESIVLGSNYVPIHMHRSIFGRLEKSELALPDGFRFNKPKFESTFVMEITNFTAPEYYGVCWSEGFSKPEILNLNTGLNYGSGTESQVSKSSFMNMFRCVNEKLPSRSDAGIQKYNEAKEAFYAALEKNNFGTWTNKLK